jgi:streptomycin 6-kinase
VPLVQRFRGLPREDVPQRLLVTDLHAENVLAARRGVQLWLFARTVQESVNLPWLRPVLQRSAPR